MVNKRTTSLPLYFHPETEVASKTYHGW